MSYKSITDARLLELIAAYGADPMEYPELERDAAQQYLEAHPERFSAAIMEALELDSALADLPDFVPSASLIEAIVCSAPQARAQKRRWFKGFRSIQWVPTAGALASLAIGALIGVNLTMPAATDAFEEDSVIYASLGLTDYDVYDEVNR